MTSNPQGRAGGDGGRDHRLGHQHRGKHSNPWRCLSPLRYGAYALVIVQLLEVLEDLICEKTPPVPSVEVELPVDGFEMVAPPVDSGNCLAIAPQWLSWVMMTVIVLSAIACVRRWWRSFSKREYYRNQLGRR